MLNQKSKEMKEKDKKLILMESRIKYLQRENRILKENANNVKKQGKELSKAIEKIHELESKIKL
jgi:hypothetical protein